MSSTIHIVPIVEGHGEVEALPILIRRIAMELGAVVEVGRPIRCHKGRMKSESALFQVLGLARQKMKMPGGIIILKDADDECPAQSGPALLEMAKGIAKDMNISVVIAKHEYESWLVASLESLAGIRGIPEGVSGEDNPEDICGAKERLSEVMTGNRRYSPRIDQSELTRQFDMQRARHKCPSFDKFWREIERLMKAK